jgi:predicted ATPase/class 3 adenylate cyclase
MEDWLRSIGLAGRIAAFRAHGITFGQFDELSEDDLQELGLNVDEQQRFHVALAALRERGDARSGPAASSSRRTLTERRPLTMMFIELVDAPRLNELMPADDLIAVVRLYQAACQAAVERYGGCVARQVSGSVLAYFCYPEANENDPERAVRAALDLLRDAETLASPAPAPLRLRIGIATGRVIISDLLAGGHADRRTIVGSTANLAARLQDVAKPGTVVLAAATHARVRGLFDCEDLDKLTLRGFAQPVPAWRVLRERAQAEQASAADAPSPTLFCNRQREMPVLAEHWAAAQAGRGGAALLIGEAGIGKSRLIETFLARHCRDGGTVIQLAASPFHVDTALFPFTSWLAARAGLAVREPAEEQRARLRAILPPASPEAADGVAVLGSLFGLTPPAANPGTPAQLREQTLTLLAGRILALTETGPLCLVVEDLHWLDATSLELLGRLVEAARGRRLLLLLAARDGFAPPWPPASITTLPLGRLAAEEAAGMVGSLFGQRKLPPRLLAGIVRQSDGVPLFVEEVVRTVLAPGEDASAAFVAEAAEARIPASLHDSLMARLDRSGIAKEIAQVASVIGRSGRRDILAAVALLPAEQLREPLATLAAAGVMARDDRAGSATYTFTHALLRDAAYDSLLREQRHALHLRVAHALQALDPVAVEQQPELMALHLTQAGQAEAAAPFWREAARRNLERSALDEAISLLRRGIAALEKVPAGLANVEWRLHLMALLGPALIALAGPGSAAAQNLYATATALCRELPDSRAHFPIYWGWWRIAQDFRERTARADAMLAHAVQHADAELLLQAHHCNWASHYFVGDLQACRGHIATGLAIYEAHDFHQQASLYGNHDAKVCAHGELAQVLWMQGRPLSAEEAERVSMQWADTLGHLGSQMHARDMRLLHRIYRRDFDAVFEQAGELLSVTAEHELADHRAKGLIFRGWATALRADTAAGLAMLEDGFAQQRAIGTNEDFPVYASLWAEALMQAGQPGRAAEELLAAKAEFDGVGLSFWMPELLRLLGEAVVADDREAAPAALGHFAAAAALAQSQGAAMLELRAAMSAARLHRRLGTPEEAAGALADALARIEEDDNGADLAAAKSLVEEYRRLGFELLARHCCLSC